MIRRPLPAAVLAALILAGPVVSQSGLLEPGVSRELARHRSGTLSDLSYDVSLRVPADRDSPVTGAVAIAVRKSDDGPLILDFADPGGVRGVSVDGAPTEYRATTTHITVPAAAGRHLVTVEFSAGDGPLNRRNEFLYTLFVPDRAHEVLPSFDQPDLKARFRLELAVPAGWMAASNAAETSRDTVGGEVVYRFAETEPIPTYLFAFAAGRFQMEERERAGRRMRLLHRETDSTKVARNLDAIFDLHGAALEWLEDYTGIPYPFGKFDFVAIPSFQYNGMEHPGAILYGASNLFLDESATRNQELARASVIAHETAHMWFGDLVTMEWFNDVWMKEVFANLLAAKIANPAFPELDHELRFLLGHYPAAYSVDRTPGANPIRQSLGNLSEAGSLYGRIIYEKAPIVMRQLERLAGEDSFRAAIRAYLHGHLFGNAGWPALVAELDRVTELDVSGWSEVWIETAGRPEIHVTGPLPPEPGTLLAWQEDPHGEGRVWDQVLDLGVLVGDSVALHPVQLSSDTVAVTLPTEGTAVVPNARGMAYGLFLLDSATVRTLLHRLPTLEPPVARAAAWLDLWELMLDGRVMPDAILALARRVIPAETDELILEHVLSDLPELFWRYLPPRVRAREAASLEGLLWDELMEDGSSSRKAAFFNALRSIATTGDAVDRLYEIWRGAVDVPGLELSERDRTTLALQLAVREVPGWPEVLDRQAAQIENPDRRERFAFIRPAVSADPAVRDSFFTSLHEVENRSREAWVVTALGYLHHPLRAAVSRRYIRPSLELLEEIRATGDIFFPTRWLSATFSGHASPEAAGTVRAFIEEREGSLPSRLMEKLLQEADPLFRAVALRESSGD